MEAHMGARLTARRRALGLTEAELASVVEVGANVLHHWESGEARIPPRALVQLATVLDCDVRYFFEGLPGLHPSTKRRYLRLIGGTTVDGSDREQKGPRP